MTTLSTPPVPAPAAGIVPTAGPASAALGMLRRREVQLLVAILGLFAVCTALHPQFGVSSNIAFILADSVTVMIVATGQTIVVLGRGIDLSVSPVLGIAVIGIGFLAQDHNLNIWLALLLAVLIGAGLGMGNGFLVSVVGIPPIIATLATLTIYGGWQFIICGGESVVSVPAAYNNFGNANLLPVVPWLVVIGVGVVAATHFFLTRTVTGRSIYAVGNNADGRIPGRDPGPAPSCSRPTSSAGSWRGWRLSIYLCQIGSATSTTGTDSNTNLMSIAATLIGGTTLLGGRGRAHRECLGGGVLVRGVAGDDQLPDQRALGPSRRWGVHTYRGRRGPQGGAGPPDVPSKPPSSGEAGSMSATPTRPSARRARARTAGRQETTWVVTVTVLLVAVLAYFCLAVPDFRELGASGILRPVRGVPLHRADRPG